MPEVSTVSRTLASFDEQSVRRFVALNREVVLERLQRLNLSRINTDFDGSVHSTGRFAEGSTVGVNRTKKGARSY